MARICPTCWHEGCRGNCKTPEQRKATDNAKTVKAIAKSKGKKGGK